MVSTLAFHDFDPVIDTLNPAHPSLQFKQSRFLLAQTMIKA